MSDYDDDFDEPIESARSLPRSGRGKPAPVVVASPAAAATSTVRPAAASTTSSKLPPVVAATRRPPSEGAPAAAAASSAGPSPSSHAPVKRAASSGADPSRQRQLSPPPVLSASSLSAVGGDGGGGGSASAEQEMTIRELTAANLELRKELLELNRELDDFLAKRGQHVGRIGAAGPRTSSAMAGDQTQAKNERLRRENHELLSKLHQANNMDRVSQLRNAIGQFTADADVLRGENRSLENVYAHQMISLRTTMKIEAELAQEKQRHLAEVRDIKEQCRAAREQAIADETAFREMTRQLERLEEKIKAQHEAGDAVRTIDDIKEQVEEKDRIVDALKYQVAVLSRTNTSDKKRAKIVSTRVAKELADIRAEAEDLRQKLNRRGMSSEIPVDTRI